MSKTIVIDAGHGGADPGAVGNGLREKDITLKVALYCDEYMRSHYPEFKPLLTRAIDKSVGLTERVQVSNRASAALFISIHTNAHTNAEANGFETFIFTASKKSPPVQFLIHPRIYSVLAKKGVRDRGQKKARFFVVENTNAPAILIELGFITNADDEKVFRDEKALRDCAKQIVNGAAAFFNLPERLCV